MPRPIHFEFSAQDPERAVEFYKNVFGWTIQKWDGPAEYWLISTGEGPGIDGGIMRAQEGQASTINTIDVEDLDAACEKVVASGGQIIMPRMAVPGVGYMAYCVDTEGVQFGLMQNDPNAQ
jgi:predicted enzyme related to lactoylglutathione lyase